MNSFAVLNDPKIKQLLNTIATNAKFESFEVTADTGANKGDGYLSSILMVQIKSNKSSKKLDLILKCAPQDSTIFPTEKLFQREIHFYSEIYPAFTKFQTERNILEPFNALPKYYGACNVDNKMILIMEDLRPSGYQMNIPKTLLNEEQVLLLIKHYAKMHAISFAMQDQTPDVFNTLTQDLNNLYTPKYVDPSLFGCFLLAIEHAITLFDPVSESIYISRLKNYEGKALEFFNMTTKTDWKHGIITHGDSWMNNFLFKYENNKLVDAKIVDFQLVRKVSPILDVGYVVYMNTDALLYNDYERFMKYYYERLLFYGKLLGTQIERLYPYDELVKEWKTYSIYGFLFGLIGVGIMLQDKDDIVDFTDLEGKDGSAANIFFIKNTSAEATRRTRNLVKHFTDNNFI